MGNCLGGGGVPDPSDTEPQGGNDGCYLCWTDADMGRMFYEWSRHVPDEAIAFAKPAPGKYPPERVYVDHGGRTELGRDCGQPKKVPLLQLLSSDITIPALRPW